MPDKKPKKEAGSSAKDTPAAAGSTQTRCEEGGQELLPGFLTVGQDDSLEFRLILCRTPAQVALFVDDKLRIDQVVQDEVAFRVPPLLPGRHHVNWSFFPTAADWQSRAEFAVNGAVVFRLRKSAKDSSFPLPGGFLFLEVLP